MRKEDLKRVIVTILKDRGMHGYELHKHLKSKEITIQISDLYRILAEMEKEGILRCEWIKSKQGPMKKIYFLDKGAKKELDRILREAIETIHMFYFDYLKRFPLVNDMLSKIDALIDAKFKGQNAVFITHEHPSIAYEWSVKRLCDKLRNGKVYLVKPSSLKIGLKFDNLVVLDGTYEDIPLKEDFADGIQAIDIPRHVRFEKSISEFHRILKSDGILLIWMPIILVRSEEYPLSLASFIEKSEHELLGDAKQVNEEDLKNLLAKYFSNVEINCIGHLAIFIASDKKSIRKGFSPSKSSYLR